MGLHYITLTYVYVTHTVHMHREEFEQHNFKSRGEKESVAEGIACAKAQRKER